MGMGASKKEKGERLSEMGREDIVTCAHVRFSFFLFLLCLCMWVVECGVHVMTKEGSCGTCVRFSPVLPVALYVERERGIN